MSIVTKQGDRRTTRLLSGEEVKKSELRLEVMGVADLLNAQLGLARAFLGRLSGEAMSGVGRELFELQLDLFRFGAEISSANPEQQPLVELTGKSHVERIEGRINALESNFTLPRAFIIPGATEASAAMDVARAVARRLERLVVSLTEVGHYSNEQGLIYMNRLSDYLFLLARWVEFSAGSSFHT
ncbi:MAG: cob(I)yrinic acid a,c-diamide adenosyltransferase, partial [bacterium]